jgi:hypothetical protein
MILYKRGEKYWNFEDEGVFYTPSKFTINTISNDFYIVYENNLKSKKYNVSEVTLIDLIGGGTFTFANINLFMQKLEQLNCPCFQKDETTIINPPIDPSDFLPSDLTGYADATLPIAETDDLLVNQGGVWKKVNKSDLIKSEKLIIRSRLGLVSDNYFGIETYASLTELNSNLSHANDDILTGGAQSFFIPKRLNPYKIKSIKLFSNYNNNNLPVLTRISIMKGVRVTGGGVNNFTSKSHIMLDNITIPSDTSVVDLTSLILNQNIDSNENIFIGMKKQITGSANVTAGLVFIFDIENL